MNGKLSKRAVDGSSLCRKCNSVCLNSKEPRKNGTGEGSQLEKIVCVKGPPGPPGLTRPQGPPDEGRKEQEVHPVPGESEEGEDFQDPLGPQETVVEDIVWKNRISFQNLLPLW